MTQDIVELTDETFQEFVDASAIPVVVDFWADWCTPCLALGAVLADLADDVADRVTIARLDIQRAPLTAERFEIKTVPTVLILRDGHVVRRLLGAKTRRQLLLEVDDLSVYPA